MLLREHQALERAPQLYAAARQVPGVTDAYATIGSHDGVVFLEARTLRDLNGALHHLQRLPGVERVETLVEEAIDGSP